MKRIATVILIILVSSFHANAQSAFGVKAGLSYNSNGDFKEFTNETTSIFKDKGKGKSGYNVGFYGKLDFGSIYLRPELVYTQTTSEYELNTNTQDYTMSKIDAPVLLGVELIGPLNVFAGPSFQYILDNDFNGLDFDKIENEFSVGFNIGASIEFGKLGIDIRYERGFNENETKFMGTAINENYTLDSRPEQIIFNLSYQLSNSK